MTRAKIVVEGTVLHHQDDNMLDIADCAGRSRSRNRERPSDAGGKEACGRSALGEQLQNLTPIGETHRR